MMSIAGDNNASALPDPLSMMVRVVSIETGANSICAGIRPTIGSFDTEVIADTSGTVIVVASTAIGAATNSTALGSPTEV